MVGSDVKESVEKGGSRMRVLFLEIPQTLDKELL